MKIKTISVCEVCGSLDMLNVLDLGNHPMCDDLKPIGSHPVTNKYPISILLCTTCKTAHQEYQIPKNTLFPANYHYRSRLTSDVLSGMDSLVNDIESSLGSVKGKVVLDVGCNDGSLLDRFAAKGAITFGVEPTEAYTDAEGRGHRIFHEYFTNVTSATIIDEAVSVDIVTFTNVFAHIEDLRSLISALSQLIHSETVIIIENHYLGSVLAGNQFDTFYHEHPRTYSATSFTYIAKELGLEVANIVFPRRYGGNIRVIMSGQKEAPKFHQIKTITTFNSEDNFIEGFIAMNSFIKNWKLSKKAEIDSLVSDLGPIPAKAFPGRAAILITLLGLDETEISCIFEKPGSPKIGHYVPGTTIPIVSDDILFGKEYEPPVMINLAWHIKNEINSYLEANGYMGKLIHII